MSNEENNKEIAKKIDGKTTPAKLEEKFRGDEINMLCEQLGVPRPHQFLLQVYAGMLDHSDSFDSEQKMRAATALLPYDISRQATKSHITNTHEGDINVNHAERNPALDKLTMLLDEKPLTQINTIETDISDAVIIEVDNDE